MASRTQSKLPKPLLPPSFIQTVESSPFMHDFPSAVYNSDAHKFRLQIRNWLKPISPNLTLLTDDELYTGFTMEAKRTTLHYSAIDGDVLRVAELIYAGATVDIQDSAGITPLYLSLNWINTLQLGPVLVNGAWGTASMTARVSQVARLLIEHADVNTSVENVPILHLACQAGHWELIMLLLQHGASPFPSPARLFRSQAEKRRFSDLVDSVGRFSSRPARPCPCFGGKLLSECHEKELLPYPAEYMCVCGSGMIYKVCCDVAREESRVHEFWDPKLKRIMHQYTTVGPKEVQDSLGFMEELRKVIPGFSPRSKDSEEGAFEKFRQNLNKNVPQWVEAKKMDPAFAYAMLRIDVLPRPRGRKISRMLLDAAQQTWNKHIDDYISQGNDLRPRSEIERAAKIGSGNGALIRICEAPSCGKVEKHDVETLLKCSKCKMAVYCSRSCQALSWKVHKQVCGSEDQAEQWLPSQTFVFEELKTMTQKMVSDVADVQEIFDSIRMHRLGLAK